MTMPRHLASQAITILGTLTGLGVIVSQIKSTQYPIDMIVYRMGVEAFFSGKELYGNSFQLSDTLSLPYLYPPFSAIALAPFTLVPGVNDDWLGNIMILTSAALLLWCLYAVFRSVTSWKSWDLWALVTMVWSTGMLSNPVVLNSSFAQINLVLMALVVADLIPRKRRLPQGWLIGVAGAIKLTPLAMCLYFLVRKDFKALVTTLSAFLLACATAAAVRWDSTQQFFASKLLSMTSTTTIGVDTTYTSNSSLRAMIDRFLATQDTLATGIWVLATLLTVFAGAWIMVQLLHRNLTIEAWLVNALIMLLVSPISWVHHWVWMTLFIPVFAWRALQALDKKDARVLLWVLGIWTLLTVVYPPQWWFGDGRLAGSLNWVQNIIVSAFVWLSIAALVLIARLLGHTHKSEGSQRSGLVHPRL